MNRREMSLVFLPTLVCDARCDYCFEDATTSCISIEDAATVFTRVFDFMGVRGIERLHVYWQGGEVLTLEPEWVQRAHDLIATLAAARNRNVVHYLQSNLLAYETKWTPLITGLFNNSVGTSMDFPNRHRRMPGGSPEACTERWTRNVQELVNSGVHVGVIAVPNIETLRLGAEPMYTFFVDQIGITSFQVNSPFPGGRPNSVKQGLPLNAQALGRFLVDLMDVWLERGYGRGVTVGPCSEVLNYFLNRDSPRPCFWQDNCANSFLCIDPKGNVSQCDCWAASYPEMRFGNILEGSLAQLLDKSPARHAILERPGCLMATTDCINCEHLALCHGGCPIRAFSTYGRLAEKDPYCDTYKMLYSHGKQGAARIAGQSF